jgi:transcriptional regulator with XRE-family HTH domain
MEVKDRLAALKDARDLTWKTLAEQLEVSESMLFRCLAGGRNASRRFMKRIAALEAGYPEQTALPKSMTKESTALYASKKELNKRDIEHRLTTISAEIAAIREILKEIDHD